MQIWAPSRKIENVVGLSDVFSDCFPLASEPWGVPNSRIGNIIFQDLKKQTLISYIMYKPVFDS